MNKNKRKIRVIRNKDKTWSTQKSDSIRTSSKSSTQAEAIGKAIVQARREGNTRVIIS